MTAAGILAHTHTEHEVGSHFKNAQRYQICKYFVTTGTVTQTIPWMISVCFIYLFTYTPGFPSPPYTANILFVPCFVFWQLVFTILSEIEAFL